VFSETRSSPILEDASKYDVSIIRFLATGTGRLLPLWIPTIDPQQTPPVDPNLTIYSLTVQDVVSGISSQAYLSYIPVNQTAPVPTQVSPQDLSTDYYYGKTYTQFCSMFNIAFNDASAGAGGPIVRNFVEQGLAYDPKTGLFSLRMTSSFYPGSGGPLGLARYQLYFNAPLYNLLANFLGSIVNKDAGRTFQLSIGGGAVSAYPTGTNVGTITQDFKSTNDVWTPIDSFCFTTTFIPLNPEGSSAPVQANDANIGQNLSVGQNFSNIVTDFCPDQSQGSEAGISQILYEPTAEYRLSCMTAKQPIAAVDITMWWRYRLTGQLIPLYMPSLATVSMKILFRRKDWAAAK
jgi:hypothetical protein